MTRIPRATHTHVCSERVLCVAVLRSTCRATGRSRTNLRPKSSGPSCAASTRHGSGPYTHTHNTQRAAQGDVTQSFRSPARQTVPICSSLRTRTVPLGYSAGGGDPGEGGWCFPAPHGDLCSSSDPSEGTYRARYRGSWGPTLPDPHRNSTPPQLPPQAHFARIFPQINHFPQWP